METTNTRKFHPLYVLSVIYAATVYLFPFLWYALNPVPEGNVQAEDPLTAMQILPLLLPACMGLVNLIAVIVSWKSLTRDQLLHCAVIIKYSLIPFFIAGGLCIALAWLLTFSPVVIMIFVGPAIVAVLSVLGYIAMLGSSPYAFGYLLRCRQEHVHHPALLAAGAILQFFFAADTISVMILALKEKKCIRSTIVLACVLALGLLIVGGFVIYGIVRLAVR